MATKAMIQKKISELEEDILYLKEGIQGYKVAINNIKWPNVTHNAQTWFAYSGGSFGGFLRDSSSYGEPKKIRVSNYYDENGESIDKVRYKEIKTEKIQLENELRVNIKELESDVELKEIALKNRKIDLEMAIDEPLTSDKKPAEKENITIKEDNKVLIEAEEKAANKGNGNNSSRKSKAYTIIGAIIKLCEEEMGIKKDSYNPGIEKKLHMIYKKVNEMIRKPTTERTIYNRMSERGYFKLKDD